MNRKLMIAVSVLIFLLAINMVKAEQTCRISFKFFINGTVDLEELAILPGESENPYSFEALPYSLRLISKNNLIVYSTDFNANFLILTDPPQLLNETTVIKKVPCIDNQTIKLEIFNKKQNKIIFTAYLSDFICNKNNLCEANLGENSANCPEDCLYERPKTSIYIYIALLAVIIAIIIFLIYSIRVARK